MSNEDPYDFISIGLGPFNLSLACLADPLPGLRSLFLEKKESFGWHTGMLVDGTTLQNPFLADLVSMADPTSRFSYLNYCKQQGRIYNYYVRENFYLTRQEYDRYCKWAASQLRNIRYHQDVLDIRYDAVLPGYVVSGVDTHTGTPFRHRARRLVLGIGSTPNLPSCLPDDGDGERAPIHTSAYLANKAWLQQRRTITVIGSGQSGAEVYHDLLKDCDTYGYTLNWVTRSPRFFQMENAKLTLELISPAYIDHFYDLRDSVKARVLEDQRSIYNGINKTLIDQIYDTLDEKRHCPGTRTQLLTNLALTDMRFDAATRGYNLTFRHTELGEQYRHAADGVVLATGYSHRSPAFVQGIRERIRWDAQGRYQQARNYSVDIHGNEIFVQNAGFHSHGLTNPDLGMACHRNARLLHALTGVDHYRAEARTTFQDFSPKADSGFVRISQPDPAVPQPWTTPATVAHLTSVVG
ncbi:lysine N6-hydroxylase [Cupriavidus sp. YR651]|uniref:lysine N(6)-hydroxylase/L-ornithine N(5)-oxygenase family protein n=1 Tax=Cupriavidus sp. YR651 TaxID=1855315 RepID=UPI00088DDC77|nr:SidA/IucD/PvdA family monooxygenase [Cupriavidus sp. YR651]SDC81739.1 lysine N6-hydroxylase [Cupriavidus sp. YR651]